VAGERIRCLALALCLVGGTAVADLDPRRAPEWQRACDGGDAAACGHLGALYEQGLGVVRDLARARALHEKACTGGYWFSCHNLIVLGDDVGRRVLADDGRRGCERGSPWSCDQLALFTSDKAESRRAFERGCDGDWGPSCYSLSLSMVSRDPARARALRQKACKLGNPNACQNERAQSTVEVSRPALEQKCARGAARACHDLAQLTDGNGTPLVGDKRRAELELRACAGHIAPGCYEAGRHERGAKRLERLSRACDGDVADACRDLAIDRSSGGSGIAEDQVEAARLHRAGCDGGSAQSCLYLGQMLARGEGVPRDAARARELYRLACARGNSDACAGCVGHAGELTSFEDALAGLEQLRARCQADRVECIDLNAATRELRADGALVARLEQACANKRPAACQARALLEAPPP
jgi:TPR repeat protein